MSFGQEVKPRVMRFGKLGFFMEGAGRSWSMASAWPSICLVQGLRRAFEVVGITCRRCWSKKLRPIAPNVPHLSLSISLKTCAWVLSLFSPFKSSLVSLSLSLSLSLAHLEGREDEIPHPSYAWITGSL